MSCNIINKELLEFRLNESFNHIKYIKLENLKRENVEIKFTLLKESIIVNVNDSENEIIILILELNNKICEINLSNKNKELISEMENIKNMFGSTEINIDNTSIDETNKVFENFGKGGMFNKLKVIQNKNELLSYSIRKKV